MTTTVRFVVLSLITLFFFGNADSWVHAQDRSVEGNSVAGFRAFTITVKDLQRDYIVYVPGSYTRSKKWPVVVMFHGGGGTGESANMDTNWDEKAENEGFLAVFPQGTREDPSKPNNFLTNPQTWNSGPLSVGISAVQRNVPDTEFVVAMLAELKKDFSVDENRIYATGFSNGAAMTFRLARELSLSFAAVSPSSGADYMADTDPIGPVPLLYITGMADPLNPMDGGPVYIGDILIGVKAPTQEMVDTWVNINGCSNEGHVIYDKDGSKGIGYGVPGKPLDFVRYYTIEEHGHYWPGGDLSLPESLAGPKNLNSIKATDVMWDFFKEHSLSDDRIKPSQPTLTKVEGGAQQIKIEWSASSDEGGSGLAGYRVDVSSVASFSSFVPGWESRNVGLVTSTMTTGLGVAAIYYVRVRAYDGDGNWSDPRRHVFGGDVG